MARYDASQPYTPDYEDDCAYCGEEWPRGDLAWVNYELCCPTCEAAIEADKLYAQADALGLDYERGFADDALAQRVADGPCDGLGTMIGTIPGRGGESGYYPCAGCSACEDINHGHDREG